MEVIIQGLRIETACRYLKVSIKPHLDIREDLSTSCFHIDVPKNFNSCDIVHARIKVLEPCILKETDYIKLSNHSAVLNGFKFTKLVQHNYMINQYIVNDTNINDYIIRFDDKRCEIIIPKIRINRLEDYLKTLCRNPYIKVEQLDNFAKLANIYSYNLSEGSGDVNSKNYFEFSTKKTYDKYLLTSVKVLDSFLQHIKGLFLDRGIDFIAYPKTKDVKSTNYVIYRITEIGAQVSRRTDEQPLRFAVQQRSTVGFELSCSDLRVLFDFRTRYQNLDFLSNLTMFNTKDKLGRSWLSNISWTTLPTDFNQEFDQDSQNNIASKVEFTATINHYEVYDETYSIIQSIIMDIIGVPITEKK